MAAVFSSETVEFTAFQVLAFPTLFLLLLGAGRLLKRRFRILFGFNYWVFSLVVSAYISVLVGSGEIPWEAKFVRHLGAASLLFGTLSLLAIIRRFYWEGWFERTQKTHAPKFLSELISLLIVVTSLLVIVGGIYGQSIEGAVFGSTIVLGIIGFAMQDLLGNIIAGIALELGKPFRIHDWLEVDGHRAEVMEVNWRSTRLRTVDDVYLDIPNKHIVGTTITNLTFPTRQHAVRITIGFEYGAAPNTVKDMLCAAAVSAPGVLTIPAPKVFLKTFADSAVLYEIDFWIEEEPRFNDICDAVRTNVWYAARRANLRMPFPIRVVQIERPNAPSVTPHAQARRSLEAHPILAVLDEKQAERLLSAGHLQHFGRGENVLVQGASGSSMFILLQGEAEVLVDMAGGRTQVATLRAGDCCGEMSLLSGEPRSATVIARTDCEMLEIDKATMGELLQANGALVQKLSDLLAERRLAAEGIVAATDSSAAVRSRAQELQRGFLKRLSAFFDL